MVVTWYPRKREINGTTEVRCAMFSTGPGIQNLLIISFFFQDGPIFFYAVSNQGAGRCCDLWGGTVRQIYRDQRRIMGVRGSQTGICLPFKPGILLLQNLY